jgi:hypothetical protein
MGSSTRVKVKNTKINEWEELTFDMSGSIGKGITGIIDQIIVFPDFKQGLQRTFVILIISFLLNSREEAQQAQLLYYQWILNLQQLLIRL